ncbi:prephenate dehydrogenase [Streptomyces cahuitamycinicus]|nr:prephenate dehydrogenase [Streptomyces cahuitamycinicus]
MRTMAVVGTGLIGTSIGLAASRYGVTVHLLDRDETSARTAAALGAGLVGAPEAPVDLAVIAVPPSTVGAVLAEQQVRGLARAYTDVASVKSQPTREALGSLPAPERFVGGHPMAGREKTGPLAARADLFESRSWVLTPTDITSQTALNHTLEMISMCGAVPVIMGSQEHDAAVALTSHVPHVLASLMAARLEQAPEPAFRLAGQGLRDVTRIAAGDPHLWSDILRSNAASVSRVLHALHEDLSVLLESLDDLSAADVSYQPHETTGMTHLLNRGIAGLGRLHDRPSGKPAHRTSLRVTVGDRQGELARLLGTLGQFGVGPDDVTTSVTPSRRNLSVELSVSAVDVAWLLRKLTEDGWEAERVDPVPRPRDHRETSCSAARSVLGAAVSAVSLPDQPRQEGGEAARAAPPPALEYVCTSVTAATRS